MKRILYNVKERAHYKGKCFVVVCRHLVEGGISSYIDRNPSEFGYELFNSVEDAEDFINQLPPDVDTEEDWTEYFINASDMDPMEEEDWDELFGSTHR